MAANGLNIAANLGHAIMGSGVIGSGMASGAGGPNPGQQQCTHQVTGPGMQGLPGGQAPASLNSRPAG